MRSHVGSSLLQSILDSQGWRIQNVKLTLDEEPQHTPFVRPTPAAVESELVGDCHTLEARMHYQKPS